MIRRRGIEEFSVSFLDVICCGFGAVILLLMLTKTLEPQVLESSNLDLSERIAARGGGVEEKAELLEALRRRVYGHFQAGRAELRGGGRGGGGRQECQAEES